MMDRKKNRRIIACLVIALLLPAGVISPSGAASAKKAGSQKTVAKQKIIRAKSLKMKQTLSLKVGEQKKLKVTVKPKKATLKWKSNRKKVVSVSGKGVVKAKKTGTAKITVSSGKKKAVCKVTVKQAQSTQPANQTTPPQPAGPQATPTMKPADYSIQSVEVVNSKVIRITLSKAKNFSLSNFSVEKKRSVDAINTRKLTLASCSHSGNTVYDLLLADGSDAENGEDTNVVSDGDYVRVSIASSGTIVTGENVYYSRIVPQNHYIAGKTGETIEEKIYFTTSYQGYLSDVTVSGLPEGLTASVSEQYVTVKGTPSEVADGVQANMTATDEMGRSLQEKILFYIGSDTRIVSYIEENGKTILANNDMDKRFPIRTMGGSGHYNYTLVDNSNEWVYLMDKDIRFSRWVNDSGQKEFLPEGNYTVSYRVTDQEQEDVSTEGTLAVTAVHGVEISGKVMTVDQQPVESAQVAAVVDDPEQRYYPSPLFDSSEGKDSAEETGSYHFMVYPGETYQITVRIDGLEKNISHYNPGNADQVLDFVLPVYKVTFQSDILPLDGEIGFTIKGAEQDGRKRAWEDSAYLPKGRYSVEDTVRYTTEEGTGVYALAAEFQVTGSMTVDLTVTKVTASE